MSNPTFYTRIQNKYDTKVNLDNSTFIPKSGELIGASGAGSGNKYKKLKIGDGINKYSDLQFVDQEALDKINDLSNEINEIKQSFQDGCDIIVDGCTTYGSTPSTNSPEDIVEAIEEIYINRYDSGVSNTKVGTAVASNVLTGKTFTNTSGVGLSGSMTNNGAISQSLSVNGTYTIPEGYHNGSGKVTQSIATKSATTYGAKTSVQTISAGQYLSGDQTIAAVTQSGLSAANIVKGKTVTIASNGSNLWSITGTTDVNELNFKIVGGTSQPSSPSTNTIWINTSTAIGEWMIAKTAPSTRRDGSALQTGDIWFVLEDFSRSVSLHILKSNRTYINIHTAHQWNGSSWVDKEAKIYQSSAWKNIPRIYRVFPSTYACTWSNWTVSTNKGTWAYASDSMYFYGHSQGSYRRLTGLLVDFSKYSKVCIHIDENGVYSTADFRFRWRNSSGTLKVDYRISDQSSITGTHTVDISSITDQCYLDIYFSNGGGGIVTDIWFEK